MMEDERQQPARIARPRHVVVQQAVEESTGVELVQEVIARADQERRELAEAGKAFADGGGPETAEKYAAAARDLSLAITHLEDARTRLNAAHYRTAGRFSISDAER